MYEKIIDENLYEMLMKIYLVVYYIMGGVWVDYNFQLIILGCFVVGEVNFFDYGVNCLGVFVLMQGLVDGYFVFFYIVFDYFVVEICIGKIFIDSEEFVMVEVGVCSEMNKFFGNNGIKFVDQFYKELGYIMWNKVGMGCNEQGLKEVIWEIDVLCEDFYKNVFVFGLVDGMNFEFEKVMCVVDFMELGQLMVIDVLQ